MHIPLRIPTFALLLLLAATLPLHAQTTYYWTATGGGNWTTTTGAAWSTAKTPENGGGLYWGTDIPNSLTDTIAGFDRDTFADDNITMSLAGTVEVYGIVNVSVNNTINNSGSGLIRLGAGGITASGPFALNFATDIEVTTDQSWSYAQTSVFSGAISGSGNLAISLASKSLTWSSAANTYSGTITVTGGRLYSATAVPTAFQNATLDTTGALANGLGFSFGSTTNTIGALQGSGDLLLSRRNNSVDSNDRGALTLNIGNNNSSTTYSGNLSQGANASSIVKIGSGTQTFAGTNSYSGTTTVNAGTLLINGTHTASTGTASYTVSNAGSTLGGTGRIAVTGTVNVGSGAILAPGASIGTLTLDGSNTTGAVLSMSSGAVFDFELSGNGGTPDRLDFWNYTSGDLLLSDNAINLSLLGTETGGTYTVDIFRFFSDSGTVGIAHGFTSGLTIGTLGTGITSATIDWDGVNNDGTSIALTYNVVPEPSTWALLVGSLSVLAIFRRRRRA